MNFSLSLQDEPSSGDSTMSRAFGATGGYTDAGFRGDDFARIQFEDCQALTLPSVPGLFPGNVYSKTLLRTPECAYSDEHYRTLPDDDSFLSTEELLDEIAFFSDEAYECYPILHPHSLIKNIEEGKHLSDAEFRILALSVVTLNEARRFRRNPQYGTARLDSLLGTVHNLRQNSNHDYLADPPSLDTVTVSWCLFMAHIFRGNIYKAFAYLTEAIGLLDLIDYPSDHLQTVRLRRIEYMLYITESGAVSLYGPPRKRRIARLPSNFPGCVDDLIFQDHWESDVCSLAQNMAQKKMQISDRRAVELLLLMARIHAASGPDEVAKVTVDEGLMATMAGLLGTHARTGTAISEQTADVAITRQWKLGWHWWTTLADFSPLTEHRTSLNYTTQILGMTALQWGKTISPPLLRLIGIGKIVALAEAILHISSTIGERKSCTNIIGDLIRMVSEADYERNYAVQLYFLHGSVLAIPPMINLNDSQSTEVHRDPEVGQT
ncbi:uncharacterized protein PV07_03157 [Cladophialophora immunda]|uniref:Transcription factor domain-containing protein n=1 Tax=Cladophialophora immunda TaxID=569365 RepID=A0A0D2B1N4_9EURO|nr:uncharacterized protein PV07_03157 [Cladophialophora immunda]KIW31512.1 hypothetical protein PV07_03157 [Cladophialophora immunda]